MLCNKDVKTRLLQHLAHVMEHNLQQVELSIADRQLPTVTSHNNCPKTQTVSIKHTKPLNPCMLETRSVVKQWSKLPKHLLAIQKTHIFQCTTISVNPQTSIHFILIARTTICYIHHWFSGKKASSHSMLLSQQH